jgi:hypothetical protein
MKKAVSSSTNINIQSGYTGALRGIKAGVDTGVHTHQKKMITSATGIMLRS